MTVLRSKLFIKQFRVLALKQKKQFEARMGMFLQDQRNPQLRIHQLKGKYHGYLSMDINGYLRVVFRYEAGGVILLGFIGTHSQLY